MLFGCLGFVVFLKDCWFAFEFADFCCLWVIVCGLLWFTWRVFIIMIWLGFVWVCFGFFVWLVGWFALVLFLVVVSDLGFNLLWLDVAFWLRVWLLVIVVWFVLTFGLDWFVCLPMFTLLVLLLGCFSCVCDLFVLCLFLLLFVGF